MKVFIYPPNSMILQDLVERFGHTPLALAKEIERRVNDPELDSPPMNITEIDVKIGLKYAAIEVPSGVRGRLESYIVHAFSMVRERVEDPERLLGKAQIVADDSQYHYLLSLGLICL